MFKRTALFIAAVILTTTIPAAAQCFPETEEDGSEPIFIFDEGVRVSEGTLEPHSGVVSGNTFVLDSFGAKTSRHFTVSLNYVNFGINPNEFMVSGGTWTLAIVTGGEYVGTVYGAVTDGTISVSEPYPESRFAAPEKVAQSDMAIRMKADGGLGIFSPCAGTEGRFDGFAFGDQISGSLAFF